MISVRLAVQVVAEETGMALPGLYVKAYDKDLLFDDLLGGAVTDREGRALILCEQGDFDEFFDRRPDVYFKVYAPDRTRLLFESPDAVRWNVGRDASFIVRVPLEALQGAHAEPAVQLFGDPGPVGQPVPPAVGDSLMISAVGLAPAAAHDVEVRDETGTLFVSRLMTDQFGVLAESVLWPQFGLDDPRSDDILTVDEADERWRGKTLGVRLIRDKRVLAEGSATVGGFDRPFVINTDNDDRMLNGFEDGQGHVAASGYNLRHDGDIRVYLVESQADWWPGDPIVPVTLRDGLPAIADARPDGQGRFHLRLAEAGAIAPGAYDFIVRRLRYGYEDDEDLILRADDVTTRRVTGVVVREEFWRSKVVHFGCVNMLPLAGRPLGERPYFRYADAFAEGENVWAAVDPAALPPVKIGKMAAIYVVPSKTSAQWDADKSLDHLALLGGNGSVIRFKTQAGCINHNMLLVWAAASVPGPYDLVIDFGNDQTDPLLFAPDNMYTIGLPPQNGDIIDGYMVPGFRIVKDPGIYTDPAFAHVGGFDYVNEGTLAVVDDDGVNINVPLSARVKFPADMPGTTLPGQISASRPSYPLAIIVHGNGHTYLAYDYLLSHWAANGFIAASIHLNANQTATDRAKVLFEHINKLKMKFGAKAENNIGIMGHSRGGEGVATAPRLNQQGGLGHNLNAVISLAPTNQHVDEHIVAPWAAPYYVIYGSLDRDVTGEGVAPLRNCGFALYDKAEGARKAMLFVYGSTHDRFLAPPGNVDLDYNWLSAADKLNALSATAHYAVALAYMTAYFRQQLLNDPQFGALFNGEWVPPSVAVADGGKAKLFSQVRDAPANRKVVDDFEGAHTATSWQTSTIGGAVSQAGLVANPTEDFLYLADNVASPHEASGLLMRWDGSGDKLEFSVPGAQQNVSGFQALSFRVTQKYDPSGTVNPLNADQDFYVVLRDTTGNERAVRVAKFGRIPYPHVRGNGWVGPVIKSALCTIRVPLHAFTIECAGAQRVNLSKVEKIGFLYQSVSKGELEVDDVEFSQ
ncbi:MAG TPA: hypothetical protein VES62_07665 [Thermoleophilaceae bacterium]|nr:hypothetical protein [Thermoleophilaceae bacterium]